MEWVLLVWWMAPAGAILMGMNPIPSSVLQQPGTLVRASGLRLPPVVFGISALGNLYQAMSEERKHAIVTACRRHTAGPVVFDGAGKYGAGLALECLGRALRAQAVAPDQVIISNKLAWRRAPLRGAEPTFEPGVWKELTHDAVMDISAEGILRCHAEGLALLGAPYRTDLVSVHDPDEYLAGAAGDPVERARRLEEIRDAYRSLIRLREQGVVKAVGIGSKDWRVMREIVDQVDVDWVMLACSLTIMSHPPELVAWVAGLARRGVAVIDSALFHGGFLTGGDHLDYRPVDPLDPTHARALEWRERFNAICAQHGILPVVACTAFALAIPGVVSVALNTTKAERVADNIAMPAVVIPPAFWRDLFAARLIDRSLEFLV
jgi:D-threo-aldose 1-dehydrogenase